MKNLLITSAGTGIAFEYATAKNKHFKDICLFTADINNAELITASLYSEKHIKAQAFSDASYLDFLNKAIDEYNIDTYIPIIDNEILWASKNSSNINCAVAVNPAKFCQIAAEKSNYEKLSLNKNIKAVKQLTFDEFVKYPRGIAKKNYSYGSKNIFIKTVNENYPVENLKDNYFFYEFIEGDEFTIDCFPLISKNKIITSVRHRIEVKSGVCTKAHLTENKILEDFAYSLMNEFLLSHPFCFQVIKKENFFYLTDINPRLGAGTALNKPNGMCFFAAHLALLNNDEPEKFLLKTHKGCIVTRQYTEYLSKIIEL